MARLLSVGFPISNAAFPVIEALATTNLPTADPASFNLNLPASISAGELLLVIAGFQADDGVTAVDATMNPASGWTYIGPTAAQTDFNRPWNLAAMWRRATGSEGANINTSLSGSGLVGCNVRSRAYRISGAGNPKFGGYIHYNAELAPDPGNLAAGILANTKWITAVEVRSQIIAAAPSSYTAEATVGTSFRTATRDLRSLTEDPGVWDLDDGGVGADVCTTALWAVPGV